jgi:hypothetical protein
MSVFDFLKPNKKDTVNKGPALDLWKETSTPKKANKKVAPPPVAADAEDEELADYEVDQPTEEDKARAALEAETKAKFEEVMPFLFQTSRQYFIFNRKRQLDNLN